MSARLGWGLVDTDTYKMPIAEIDHPFSYFHPLPSLRPYRGPSFGGIFDFDGNPPPDMTHTNRDISSGRTPSPAGEAAECGGGKARTAQKRDGGGAEHYPHDVILRSQGMYTVRGPFSRTGNPILFPLPPLFLILHNSNPGQICRRGCIMHALLFQK